MAGGRTAVEVEGGPEFRRAMRRLGADVGELKAVHRELAEDVASSAESLVPVLSGRLRDRIRPRATSRAATVTAGGRGVPYAGPIHFGWRERNIEPQPFLYDALDDRRDEVRAAYAGHVAGLVRRFDREAPD